MQKMKGIVKKMTGGVDTLVRWAIGYREMEYVLPKAASSEEIATFFEQDYAKRVKNLKKLLFLSKYENFKVRVKTTLKGVIRG